MSSEIIEGGINVSSWIRFKKGLVLLVKGFKHFQQDLDMGGAKGDIRFSHVVMNGRGFCHVQPSLPPSLVSFFFFLYEYASSEARRLVAR